MIRAALLSLALLPLTACNFTPVYGGQGEAFAANGPITITEIPGRTGHYLRNELARTVGQGIPGFPKGTLEITLSDAAGRSTTVSLPPNVARGKCSSPSLRPPLFSLPCSCRCWSASSPRGLSSPPSRPCWTCSGSVPSRYPDWQACPNANGDEKSGRFLARKARPIFARILDKLG